MRIIVTAGPTREYIDAVRFISNASSGKMGCAVARAAGAAGHRVTLILGAGASATVSDAEGIEIVRFTSVDELRDQLARRFADCDALIMSAAVGDFRPESVQAGKLKRSAGPITLRLVPTEDILAGLSRPKRGDQRIVAFAVEDGPTDRIEAKALRKMQRKGADFVVVNTPAAMDADESLACILSPDGVVAPWATRSKDELARQIVNLLG